MTESRRFEIRLAATEGGKQKNLSIAELGVLLTGINRAINKAVAAGTDVELAYFPPAQEPANVRSEVLDVKNGSIVLTVVSSVSEFVDKNIIQAAFLAGIFGNAAWDFTKLVSAETVRALRRLGTSVRLESEYVRIDPTLANEAPQPMALPRESADRSFEISDVTGSGHSPTDQVPIRTTYSVTFYQDGERAVEISISSTNRTG